MKSRTFAGAVAIVAVSTAFSGCAVVDGSGDSPHTLRVMMGVDTTFPKQRAEWQRQMAKEFKATTGENIQWETWSSPTDELTAIQTSVISGQGPDVYSLGTTFTPTAYATGGFVTLTKEDWDAIGGQNRFTAASLGISGPSPSKQIGIPLDSRPYVMAVNTKILAEHGITSMPKTWDQLTADAKATTGNGTYGLAIDYADGADPWKVIWGMAANAGNSIVDGNKATIDSPAVTKAYTTYFDWLTKDKVVNPASVGWSGPQATAAFADGKAAFYPMTSVTATSSFEHSAVSGHYKFVVLPNVPPGATERPPGGSDAASILSGDNLVVANYSDKQKLAFQFVKQITSKSAQLEYYRDFGSLPTNAAALQQLATSDPSLAPHAQAASLSRPTAFTGAWADIQLDLNGVVSESIPDLKSGDVSADTLERRLAAAQKSAQGSLDRQKNGGL